MKLLLFDFDGVIVDSFHIGYACMKEFQQTISEETYRSYFNGNVYESEAVDEKDYDPAKDPFFDLYLPRIMTQPPVKGMPDVLRRLASARTLAIVSSTLNAPISEYIAKYNLARYFKKIYGADVHMSKHVKIRMALADFNTAPEDCIFVTDTLGDMREAAREGVRSIGVTWGFHTQETLLQGRPIAILNSPEELSGAING